MNQQRITFIAHKIHRLLLKTETGLLVILLTSMIAIAVAQIILRNFFGSGILWGESYVRIAVLWLTLIGGMIASRTDNHISIDVINTFLSDNMQARLKRIVSFITAGICLIAAWYSYLFVMIEYEDGGAAFASVPNWVCESIIPFAFTIISLRYFLISVFGIKHGEAT